MEKRMDTEGRVILTLGYVFIAIVVVVFWYVADRGIAENIRLGELDLKNYRAINDRDRKIYILSDKIDSLQNRIRSLEMKSTQN